MVWRAKKKAHTHTHWAYQSLNKISTVTNPQFIFGSCLDEEQYKREMTFHGYLIHGYKVEPHTHTHRHTTNVSTREKTKNKKKPWHTVNYYVYFSEGTKKYQFDIIMVLTFCSVSSVVFCSIVIIFPMVNSIVECEQFQKIFLWLNKILK